MFFTYIYMIYRSYLYIIHPYFIFYLFLIINHLSSLNIY